MSRRRRRRFAASPLAAMIAEYAGTPAATERPTSPTRYFGSLTDAVAAAVCSPDWTGYAVGKGDFAGAEPEEARNMAINGWPEGAARATELANRIASRVLQGTADAVGTELEYDVAGAAYDPGALYSGCPEAWLRPQETHAKRAISICYNAAASGGVSTETLMQRGLAVAALVLALQSRGYPVTVDVVECSIRRVDNPTGPGFQSLVVRVIDASVGSPLDVDRLTYALGHPSMLRMIIANAYGTYHTWGHARPSSDALPGGTDTYDLYIGGVHLYDVERWDDGGEAWVLAEYERQTRGDS